jgi:pimeloyl-ACP methyl ester carboxylesterase
MTTDHVARSPDGVELAIRDHGGDGPDVLFLHGRSRTLADRPPVLAHLNGVRAVAIDQRWHGRSGVGGSVSIDALPRAFYELGLGADTDRLEIALEKAECPIVTLLCTGQPKTPSERDAPLTTTRDAMLRALSPLPYTDVRTIDGSHAVIWEKPDEIAAIVRSLL